MKTKLKKILRISGLMVSFFGTALAATAGTSSTVNPIVFPAKGQTQQQMAKDKTDCYNWAKQQTGYDPMTAGIQTSPQTNAPQVAQQPPPNQARGGAVRGGARGAAAGAAIGAIAGDAGKGAAIGAASGGAVGGIRQRRYNNSQSQAQQQQQAAINQQASQQQAAEQTKIDAYNRAFAACMEAKGYTVK